MTGGLPQRAETALEGIWSAAATRATRAERQPAALTVLAGENAFFTTLPATSYPSSAAHSPNVICTGASSNTTGRLLQSRTAAARRSNVKRGGAGVAAAAVGAAVALGG